MKRTTRVLTRLDPARHLGPLLDERAEAELAALTGARPATPPSAVKQQHAPRRRRLQPVVTTGLVAAAVAAVSLVVIVNSPVGPAVGGSSTSTPAAAPPASPSSAPTASPDPTSEPAGAYSGPLIAMDGARSWTREQLHARRAVSPEPDDPANAAIGEEQDWITIQCMAEHGYLYDPTFTGSQGLELGKTWGLTSTQLEGYRTALWGENLHSSKPYDWRNAGCHGQAVHLTGQDNAN